MDDPLIQEFLLESNEYLDQFDKDLVALERDPGDAALIDGIFRTLHTIKGNAGLLGFPRLERLGHVGESLLSKVRDGRLRMSAPIASHLLAMGDTLRRILRETERLGHEPPGDDQVLLSLTELLTEHPAVAALPPSATQELLPVDLDRSDPDLEPVAVEEDGGGTTLPRSTLSGATVRVGVQLLDQLMNLVGELVLSRNALMQIAGELNQPRLSLTCQRLDHIASELQTRVMTTRMHPIAPLWRQFPRIVRDQAHELGKQVQLRVEGADTELDRSLIEAIKDPLTHLVRNAISHGIEAPAAREAAGKSPQGNLLLRASHEAGQIWIEISDDGRGIDPEQIRHAAVERGLLGADAAAQRTAQELIQLIFEPGFSTAAEVTRLSGRGVGMDVVRSRLGEVGGSVEVHSRPGFGATFRLRIPLTLAILPALLVRCGDQPYAIAQASLVELVRIEHAREGRGIETFAGVPVYRLRDRLIPLVYLDRLLGLRESDAPIDPRPVTHIVVVESDDQRFGLVADAISDTQDVVVRPLDEHITSIGLYAGATITGDGRIALILDVGGIARQADVLSPERMPEPADKQPLEESEDTRSLLIVAGPDDGRMAIPLSMVVRLEEMQRSRIEQVGPHPVIQYYGQILPLIDVLGVLPERRRAPRQVSASAPDDDPDLMSVVVCNHNHYTVGLIVPSIIDTVRESVAAVRPPTRTGVLFTAVIGDRVTEMLDVPELVTQTDPSLSQDVDLD